MKTHPATHRPSWRLLLLSASALFCAPMAWSQVPVDERGDPIEPIVELSGDGESAGQLMTPQELEDLIGPIALYPDDLLAVVLPASTYPLEIVQAARFLEEQGDNDSLEPDESWDDSVVALLNYPEVLEMMNDDLDWTWRLGEAVANQQADVIAAVEAFRDRAYAAGNLKTDEHQTVTENDNGIIEIQPVNEEIIYVPYYEPARVVVYQPRPVYSYYPRPYPVYYYPYPHGYNFYSDHFWGVTTAFSIGWATNHLHVFHPSYLGHPYYGHTYYPRWWYRRPSITVYNNYYGDSRSERTRDHYARGDVWRPRDTGGARPGFDRSRADYYRDRRARSSDGYRDRAIADNVDRARRGPAAVRTDDRSDNRTDGRSAGSNRPAIRGDDRARRSENDTIRFREREGRAVVPLRERDIGTADRPAATRTETQRRTPPAERAAQPAQRERQAAPGVERGVIGERPRARPDSDRRQTTTRPPLARSPASAPASAPRPAATRQARPSRSAPTPQRNVSQAAPRTQSAPRSNAGSSRATAPRPPAASIPRSAPRPSGSSRAAAPRPAPRESSRPAGRTEASQGNRRLRDR